MRFVSICFPFRRRFFVGRFTHNKKQQETERIDNNNKKNDFYRIPIEMSFKIFWALARAFVELFLLISRSFDFVKLNVPSID